MTVAVLELSTNQPQPSPAELEWHAIQAWLRQNRRPVLLAATYDQRNEHGRTHILARKTIKHRSRYLPGIDTSLWMPFPAEAAFCGVASAVRDLEFRLHLSRHEEHRIGLPNCLRCLRFCTSLTGLPTDELAADGRKIRRPQVRGHTAQIAA